jgi:phage-related protein
MSEIAHTLRNCKGVLHLGGHLAEESNEYAAYGKPVIWVEAIETLQRIPANYLKSISTAKGLFEARIELSGNIWRVFCFFDEGSLVILLNGFTKKTQKTPKKEIEKAVRLMNAYYSEKKKML